MFWEPAELVIHLQRHADMQVSIFLFWPGGMQEFLVGSRVCPASKGLIWQHGRNFFTSMDSGQLARLQPVKLVMQRIGNSVHTNAESSTDYWERSTV